MVSARIHPDAVEFDTLMCCAMEQASKVNNCEQLLRKYGAEVTMAGLRHDLDILLGIFHNTTSLVFIPTRIHSILYSSIAQTERKRLDSLGDERLDCGHSAAQHREAFLDICVKLMTDFDSPDE